ncbi:hypothetical protein JKF63_03129 [Porcisia hertigi]|uniref:C3H1-type domain-containing protein n=1 Tax=Porcisia hertigi TaxID=2761500 RepID=A0A836I8K7_9TRYP|nr:hypothetical protein JKF63_03129 [Porcisia hertigi]
MGGCSKGGRCPFSHELVQLAPKGVDVSAGFFISGNVANYKSATSATAALPSSHSLGGRWDEPTASSSIDGLSTIASSSSGCVTTGTSLSVETKEWVGADSAGVSSLANSATTSITSVQSKQGAASQTICRGASSARDRSGAVPHMAKQMSPVTMPNSQQAEIQWKAENTPKSKPSLPQPHQHTQQHSPLQPRSTASTRSAPSLNHPKGTATPEARPLSTALARSDAAARNTCFTHSPSASESTTIAALASFIDMQRASTATSLTTPVTSGTLQPSNVVFVHRGRDQTPATVPSPATPALPRYTAVSTSTDAAARRSSFSDAIPGATNTVIPSTPARGNMRTATPSRHVEAPLLRTQEALASSAQHRGAAGSKPHFMQSSAVAPATAAAPTASTTHTRVMPPAPRSQQKQAAEQSRQLHGRKEGQQVQQIRPQHETQLAQQRTQLHRLHHRIQHEQQQQQQQQHPIGVVTTSRTPANSTPPPEGIAAPVQLPLGYTLAYAVPASTPTASASTPMFISEQMGAASPTYTLFSSCPPQTQLQSFQTAKGTVLCMASPKAVPQSFPAGGECAAPRLILLKSDGSLTVLRTATFSAGGTSGLQR